MDSNQSIGKPRNWGSDNFAGICPEAGEALKKQREGWWFYDFPDVGGTRLMCSWDTTEDDVKQFVGDAVESAEKEKNHENLSTFHQWRIPEQRRDI